jgi:hypothetical protein
MFLFRFEESGDYDSAIKAYERALKFAADNQDAVQALSRLQLKKPGKNGSAVIDLTGDADNSRRTSTSSNSRQSFTDQDALARRKRIAEFEKLKEKLAKKTKR